MAFGPVNKGGLKGPGPILKKNHKVYTSVYMLYTAYIWPIWTSQALHLFEYIFSVTFPCIALRICTCTIFKTYLTSVYRRPIMYTNVYGLHPTSALFA